MTYLYRACMATFIALSLGLSAGCGYLFGDDGMFRDKSEDYKYSPEKPKLKLPEGSDDTALQDVYVVPSIGESLVLSGEFEVPRPTPLVAGGGDEIVRIQKLGEERWALINMAPGALWPQVRSFLTAAGLQLARIDARAGVLETRWVELEGHDMASRFRFRIEQGVQRGNSELHVLQMNQSGDINQWRPRSDNLELEADMLQGVAQFIADSADTASVSMIADQAISAAGKISLQESPTGGTYIKVGLPFDRAWASLARALQLSTFEIDDRNRSTGEYYVTFIGPEEEDEGGWFDWMFEEEGDPLAGEKFIVSVAQQGDSIMAISLRPQNEALSLELRQQQALLSLIKGNIN